jgi:hypothetical protein
MILPNLARNAIQWFVASPERALERAFAAAVKITEIENSYFQGQKVSRESLAYSDNTFAYFRGEVTRYLLAIRIGLAEFKTSRLVISLSEVLPDRSESGLVYADVSDRETTLSAIEKLKFIDTVVNRYKTYSDLTSRESEIVIKANETSTRISSESSKNNQNQLYLEANGKTNLETVSDKTNIVPRSILKTVDKIRKEVSSTSEGTEEEVIKKFRISSNKTKTSIRFLLLLILIPLITYQISKNFIVAPFVNNYFKNHEEIVFINRELEEEALDELNKFEATIHFQNLLGSAPEISPEKIETEVKDKANEILEEYRWQEASAIGNIFADLLAFIAFCIFIFQSKREIIIFKSFCDEIFYGLSDAAKAFLIILVSDMFVGFHSPHGWEILLEGLARHLGLPENKSFDGLFIATFPVILDTMLKYWIFRYLNRLSPSAVATYRNMNE